MRTLLYIAIFALAIAVVPSCDRKGNKGSTLPSAQLPDIGYELLEPTLYKAPHVFRKTGVKRPLPTLGENLSTVPGVTLELLPNGSPWSAAQWSRSFDIMLPLPSMLVIQTPYDCPILDDVPLPPGVYRLEGAVEKKDHIWPTIAGALEKSFAVRIRRTRREHNVWVLSTLSGEAPSLAPTVEEEKVRYVSWLPDHWECHGYAMPDLIRELVQKCLGWIVIDETGLKGRYDFELPVLESDPSTVISGITQLGLRLQMAQRQIDVIVIERVDAQPSAPPDADR